MLQRPLGQGDRGWGGASLRKIPRCEEGRKEPLTANFRPSLPEQHSVGKHKI